MISIAQRIAVRPALIFLIDGSGALFTTLSLVLLIIPFSEFWGTDSSKIIWLAVIAGCLAVYSLSCFHLTGTGWKKHLLPLIAANTTYCILTALMICKNFSTMTMWGKGYFVGEILVILTLVYLEVCLIRIGKAG